MSIAARYQSLRELQAIRPDLGPGPVAICLAEDPAEIGSTLRHLAHVGFRAIVFLAHRSVPDPAPGGLDLAIHRVDWSPGDLEATEAVNAVIDIGPGLWMHYTFNAEYLFYPFAETRSITEMLAFHAEERRGAMLTYVIDLYSSDLDAHPDAVSLEHAHLDRSGYYALARPNPETGRSLERQFDFYGGLKWRFEEHVRGDARRIDRISLFRAEPGLRLRPDHTLNVEEMNTYACPWHHNLTAAVCSFRTAKALCTNPGSRAAIRTLEWHNSTRFEWHSQQLMDLGVMEPGQWF